MCDEDVRDVMVLGGAGGESNSLTQNKPDSLNHDEVR